MLIKRLCYYRMRAHRYASDSPATSPRLCLPEDRMRSGAPVIPILGFAPTRLRAATVGGAHAPVRAGTCHPSGPVAAPLRGRPAFKGLLHAH